jgi:hypothetical protein
MIMTIRKRTKGKKNDLQSTTHKTKDWATWTLLKSGGKLRCYGIEKCIQMSHFVPKKMEAF